MDAIIDHHGLHDLAAHALVPTMGALHEGHISLIRLGAKIARERGLAGGCVATVFVNPAQFNEHVDFDDYPRTLESDVEIAMRAGASGIYAPTTEQVYPDDGSEVPPSLPRVAMVPELEDKYRPGHFEGVCRVLKRLFELTKPVCAIFGEKDYQQVLVARALCEQESLPVEIIAGETIREHDGLAMSSRNVHLTPDDRAAARSLSDALLASQGIADPAEAERTMRGIMERAGARCEYAVVRDAQTLEVIALDDPERPKRSLVAARVGKTRLLDNMPWGDVPTAP